MVWTFTASSLTLWQTQLRPYDDGDAVFNVAELHWGFPGLVHLETCDVARKDEFVDLLGRRVPLVAIYPHRRATAARAVGKNGRNLLWSNRCAPRVMIDSNAGDCTHHIRYVLRIAVRDVICREKSAVSVPLARAETGLVQRTISTR